MPSRPGGRAARFLTLAVAFVLLTGGILFALYRTAPGRAIAFGLPDRFWALALAPFETGGPEQLADSELIVLTGLSAILAAVVLVLAAGLGRLLRRR